MIGCLRLLWTKNTVRTRLRKGYVFLDCCDNTGEYYLTTTEIIQLKRMRMSPRGRKKYNRMKAEITEIFKTALRQDPATN